VDEVVDKMIWYDKKHDEAKLFARHTENLLMASDSVFSSQQALKLEYDSMFAELFESVAQLKERSSA
jgi:hypothetical protein